MAGFRLGGMVAHTRVDNKCSDPISVKSAIREQHGPISDRTTA